MVRVATMLVLLASVFASGCVPLIIGGAAAGGALVAADRRPPGVQLTDERIELEAGHRVGDLVKSNGHINITSYNKQMLLTGETTTEDLKKEVERTASSLSEIKGILNEIQVGPLASIPSRSNDAYLTGAVKAQFVREKKFNPVHVKVVTESGVVYLMGLVTRKEADDATHIARHVSGVKRVVRAFEYVVYNLEPTARPAGESAKPASTESSK
jgi:osmotically-inducible protein OsmY